MSAVTVVSALTKIPWAKIGTIATILLEISDKINKTIKDWPVRKSKKLEERINDLELFEEEQMKFVNNISLQVDNLTTALQIVSKRVGYFLVLSLLAFILGLASLVLILIK